MKLKIIITGAKVHDVGYRVFLLKNAMNLAIPGLSVYNWNDEGGPQQVIALVEGDQARIAAFKQAITEKAPELAEVSKIDFEPYDGDIGKTSELAMLCSFVQLDKAIPLLLEIQKNTKPIPNIVEEIKGLRDEIQPGLGEQLRQMQTDIRVLKDRAGIP
jgi:acylphosphatase